MLFNSAGFIFIFMPLTIAGFAVAVRLRSTAVAIAVLIVASYAFYGWWEPWLPALLGASTAFNFTIGWSITHAARRKRPALVRILLWIGIAGDLGLLGYFKYADFFIANVDAVTGLSNPHPTIALPIGISFYTFTQIAFLADAAQGRIERLRLADYVLFVSYFPHLIAGPIIHHRATIPQFRRIAADGWDIGAIAVGLSIFAIGLFKKIILADNVAPFADAVFSNAAAGPPPLLDGWIGSIAYAFQIYFDFSGYSDMAIGLSLLFGVRLPVNFASPYKSTSIVEFWSRWHMSLSAFLRDYLYIPLGGNRKGAVRRYANLMVTMLLGGLWHGAAWTFVIWGGLHGLYLVINHAWRFAFGPPSPDPAPSIVWLKRISVCLAVTIAWVFFRSDSFTAASNMFAGMSGTHGFAADSNHATSLGWLAVCVFIVWALPNTYQLFARFNPTLPLPAKLGDAPADFLAWRVNAASAMALGSLFAGCILAINRFSPFLYFRF
jgi:D-alanyl-lipoteichoic acid acyltransferase DltB (MBOAT superfamily)